MLPFARLREASRVVDERVSTPPLGAGRDDDETFLLKRSQIKAEQEKLREQARALRC
jgi:hypothetical protein